MHPMTDADNQTILFVNSIWDHNFNFLYSKLKSNLPGLRSITVRSYRNIYHKPFIGDIDYCLNGSLSTNTSTTFPGISDRLFAHLWRLAQIREYHSSEFIQFKNDFDLFDSILHDHIDTVDLVLVESLGDVFSYYAYHFYLLKSPQIPFVTFAHSRIDSQWTVCDPSGNPWCLTEPISLESSSHANEYLWDNASPSYYTDWDNLTKKTYYRVAEILRAFVVTCKGHYYRPTSLFLRASRLIVLAYSFVIQSLRSYSNLSIRGEITPSSGDVIIYLQWQPEATVDFWCAFTNDYDRLVSILSANQSIDRIFIRPHPGTSIRKKLSVTYIRQLLRHRNVFLADPAYSNVSIDSSHTPIIFTFAGTIGLELSARGLPVTTLGEVFYDAFPNVTLHKTLSSRIIPTNRSLHAFSSIPYSTYRRYCKDFGFDFSLHPSSDVLLEDQYRSLPSASMQHFSEFVSSLLKFGGYKLFERHSVSILSQPLH